MSCVSSTTFCCRETHLKTLEEVWQRLDKHNVRLNKTKCQFVKSEVTYLGHTVSVNGIQPIQNKVEAIRKAPPPVNLTELQSFLAALQYYAKFVPNLSTVLHSLYTTGWRLALSGCGTVLVVEHLTNAKGCLVRWYSLTTTKTGRSFLPRMQAHTELELWLAISGQMG